MKLLQIPLDKHSHHYLQFLLEQNGLTVKISYDLDDRRSLLHNSFKHNLFFRSLGKDFYFLDGLDQLALPNLQEVEVFVGKFELVKLATVKIIDNNLTYSQHYILSPFETRFLAQNGFPHEVKSSLLEFSPTLITDLHTHFAGCISGQDLVQIGIDHNVEYPSHLLELAGIHVQEQGQVALSSLSLELKKILAQRICIPLDRRMAFLGMEKIYQLRSPITKNLNAFTSLCWQIARDYQAMGVKYIELSYGNIVYERYLKLVHQVLPNIEAETGLTIRFLAAIGRRDDLEWDLDYIEQIKQMSVSKYIVGVDFLGHEVNSTYVFARQIKEICEWADKNYPGFVVRIHAGENPAHPENIRAALELTQGYKVQLRIGHGLFGVDENTLEKLKSANAIVEFNLNSNLALNNIQTTREVPIKQYIDKNINVVLGTDGYGIYQTSALIEAQAALLAGVNKEDFAKIQETEKLYCQQRDSWDSYKNNEISIPKDVVFKHYTPEIVEHKKRAKAERDQALLDRLKQINIPLLSDQEVNELLKGKQVISFAGAWYKSWKLISEAEKEKIYQMLDKLFAVLDSQEVIIVTGGTSFGIANVVQQRAMPLGFKIIATLVKDTPPMWLEPNSVTYTCMVGEDLYDKAPGLYQLMKEHHGLCLFIGGGNIVSDEIQIAINLRLNYWLMKGPEGASSLHAEQHPDRCFSTAEEVLTILESNKPWLSTNEPYWHLGANPTVDIVLTRKNPETKKIEVLLIRREDNAAAEPGKWALPGGFQHTDAPQGSFWQPGRETPREACVRELLEETSLNIKHLESELIFIGSYEGEGRDPRDSKDAWSRSTVFALHLPETLAKSTIAGADDASDAFWIEVDPFPHNLAFDHSRILRDALTVLKQSH